MGLRLYQSRQDTAARLVIVALILVCELVKNLSVLIISVAGMVTQILMQVMSCLFLEGL